MIRNTDTFVIVISFFLLIKLSDKRALTYKVWYVLLNTYPNKNRLNGKVKGGGKSKFFPWSPLGGIGDIKRGAIAFSSLAGPGVLYHLLSIFNCLKIFTEIWRILPCCLIQIQIQNWRNFIQVVHSSLFLLYFLF